MPEQDLVPGQDNNGILELLSVSFVTSMVFRASGIRFLEK